MKKHRRLVHVLIGLGVVIACCTIAYILAPLIPCTACKVEKEVGARYGLEGEVNVEVISDYFDRQVVKGQMQDEVFTFFRKGSPDVDVIHPYGTLGSVRDVPNASCYYVKYDDVLDVGLLLNRYICFDGDKRLIYMVSYLALW